MSLDIGHTPEKFTPFHWRVALFWVVVSLLFGVFLANKGEVFKYVLVPVVAWVLWNPRAEYLPALTVLMNFGTTLTVFAAFAVILVCIDRLNILRRVKADWIFYLLLAMLPFYGYLVFSRMRTGMPLSLALSSIDYYWAFWFLLYGIILSYLIGLRPIIYAVYVYVGLVLIRLLGLQIGALQPLYRYASFVEVFMISLAFIALFGGVRGSVRQRILILIGAYLLLVFVRSGSYKFTFFLSVFISILALPRAYTWGRMKMIFPDSIRSIRLRSGMLIAFVFPLVFLAYALISYEEKGALYDQYLEGNYFDDFSLIGKKMMAKLFADRAPIWSGLYDALRTDLSFFPSIEEIKIRYEMNGSTFLVDFESHNLFLELFRTHGLLFGLIMNVVLVICIYRLYWRVPLNASIYEAVLRSSLFAVSFTVYLVGQYILQLNVSFAFMTLVGYVAYNVTNDQTFVQAEAQKLPETMKKDSHHHGEKR